MTLPVFFTTFINYFHLPIQADKKGQREHTRHGYGGRLLNPKSGQQQKHDTG